jgi:hypothetical protein
MEGEPVADAGFLAHGQGFEAVEPSVGVFDHRAAVEFRVKECLVIGLPIGNPAVAGDAGFDGTDRACLAQLAGVKGAVWVKKQAVHGNARRFEQDLEFFK